MLNLKIYLIGVQKSDPKAAMYQVSYTIVDSDTNTNLGVFVKQIAAADLATWSADIGKTATITDPVFD